ncbi:MAG: hypothetical protein II685_01770 [Clostridia bacterium]|nr:hypothetical protein [Clostridia bacterium]
MNIERMIKTEAKKRLSGNWPIAFFSVLNLLFIPILSLLLISMAYVVVGEDNDVAKALSDSPQTAALFVLFHVVGVAAVIFLSPLYTGFVRIYSSIANGKTVDPSDLIYFFETPSRYKKAVRFMTGVIMKSAGIFILCSSVGLVLAASDEDLETFGFVLTAVGAFAAFLIIHRFAFSAELFSYRNFDPHTAVSEGAKIAKSGTKNLIKLAFSFVPWLLLTFFVVPFVYVYPYMTCSYFVSVKYLSEQYFKNQQLIKEGQQNYQVGMTQQSSSPLVPPITKNNAGISHFPKDGEHYSQNIVVSSSVVSGDNESAAKADMTAAKNDVGNDNAAADFEGSAKTPTNADDDNFAETVGNYDTEAPAAEKEGKVGDDL